MKIGYFLFGTSLDLILNDLVESITQGVEWGNVVAISLTASLLAISLIRFLFDRS